MRQQGRGADVRGVVTGLLVFIAVPADAQTGDETLPPGRPIPRTPMVASRVGKPYSLVSAVAKIPDAAQSAGHHGKVSISGTVSADGHFVDSRVTTSSRSAMLDDAALVAGRSARFIPARDANGDPITATFTMTLDFTARQHSALYSREQYRCASMVKDTDWWQATWPETTAEPDPLYSDAREAFVMLRSGDAFINEARRARLYADFAPVWTKILTYCRAQPDIAYADAWRENGIAIPVPPAPRWVTPR